MDFTFLLFNFLFNKFQNIKKSPKFSKMGLPMKLVNKSKFKPKPLIHRPLALPSIQIRLNLPSIRRRLNLPPIHSRRGLPNELINEFFGSMPLKNAYGLLAKLSNGLLAKNIQKLMTAIKEAMKTNKLNEHDSGQKLIISADGFEAKHSGPQEFNSVRTVFPVPQFIKGGVKKPAITFYFEAKISRKSSHGVGIGFSAKEFQIKDNCRLGVDKNSVGLWNKSSILVNGFERKFETSGEFITGDVIGLGIVQQPTSVIEIFATLNGELLGKTEAQKFADVTLFPVVILATFDESIRVYFLKEDWYFTEFKNVVDG